MMRSWACILLSILIFGCSVLRDERSSTDGPAARGPQGSAEDADLDLHIFGGYKYSSHVHDLDLKKKDERYDLDYRYLQNESRKRLRWSTSEKHGGWLMTFTAAGTRDTEEDCYDYVRFENHKEQLMLEVWHNIRRLDPELLYYMYTNARYLDELPIPDAVVKIRKGRSIPSLTPIFKDSEDIPK